MITTYMSQWLKTQQSCWQHVKRMSNALTWKICLHLEPLLKNSKFYLNHLFVKILSRDLTSCPLVLVFYSSLPTRKKRAMDVIPIVSESDAAFCRICFENSPHKSLISPCDCSGTISSVHRKCVESWLTRSRRTQCELCGVKYVCKKEHPTLCQWLMRHPRPLITDALLCILLTPLAALSVMLCYKGAVSQVAWQHAFESLCLFALGSFLLGVYLAWICLTLRSHYQSFEEWRQLNPHIKVVWPVPSDGDGISLANSTSAEHTIITMGDIGNDDDVFESGQYTRRHRLYHYEPLNETSGNNTTRPYIFEVIPRSQRPPIGSDEIPGFANYNMYGNQSGTPSRRRPILSSVP